MIEKLMGLPLVAAEHGHDVDRLMVYVHYLMAALFVGWMAFFIYVLYRFRARRQAEADYAGVQNHASTWLEGAVAAVEGVLLIGFAVPFWSATVEKFPAERESTVVRVVAEQFLWNFVYPGPDGKFGRQDLKFVAADNAYGFDKADAATKDNVIVLNELHVPINKPVILNVSSKDVIHCFKVVPLRVTQDAIPGLHVPAHFVPNKEGKYQVICAQLCGNGHTAMTSGLVVVESQEAFDKWLAEKSKSGGAPATFE